MRAGRAVVVSVVLGCSGLQTPDGSVTDATGEPGSSEPGGTGEGGQTLLLQGAIVVGHGPADVRVAGDTILAVGALDPLPGETVVELTGHWLAPAFVDSHVHLAYLPTPDALARGGVAAAVDLAAPVSVFEADFGPLRMVLAGPMVTAIGGYPTQSWGAGGYGLECADAAAAEAAVDLLHDLGAGVIKLPVSGGAQLDDAALAAAAERAHGYGLAVVSHALGDGEAARAAAAGADVLAHVPTSALSPATLDAWSGRAVISTLRAFGGSSAALGNLAALRERGAVVLYGTDYGNSTTPGIDRGELELLAAAGLSPAEILAAGTEVPAGFWGLSGLGSLDPGKDASLLVLAADPLSQPTTLAEPERVMLRGVWMSEPLGPIKHVQTD